MFILGVGTIAHDVFSFGEQGFKVILDMLDAIFPSDNSLPDAIKRLTREEYLRLVLVPEVTIELVLRKEKCTRLEAQHIAYDSCIWGGAPAARYRNHGREH
jgi:hypothetical protein